MANYGFDSTTYDNEDRLTAWSRVDDNKDQSWELSTAGDWDSFTEEGTRKSSRPIKRSPRLTSPRPVPSRPATTRRAT